MTFFELEHMMDATQLRVGWGGVGMPKTHRSLRKQKTGLHDMSRAKKRGSECGTGKGRGCSEHIIYRSDIRT